VLQVEAGTTLMDILKDLGITRRVVISVNGAHVTDKSRRLQDGDEVKIFSSISGGSVP
jgi:thiamine biosynthesis protein ThiS